MTVFIFTGPTLTSEEVHAELPEAVVLPPAAQGDVYRVMRLSPTAIGIIDGYFERVPSVWHKEILWAMSEGVHVYGAASMGALRAAELAAFGMVGVGAIYEAYASGALEDDDEVAVAHLPADENYRPLSNALVDIRATVETAFSAGVITEQTAIHLITIAKNLFYPARVYPAILAQAAEREIAPAELDAFRAWLPTGMIHQKRLDALAMLRQLRDELNAGLARKSVTYTFHHTEVWDNAVRSAGTLHLDHASTLTLPLQALLDELRVEGRYEQASTAALLRFLMLQEARVQGVTLTPELLQTIANDFREARGLWTGEAVEAWLKTQELDQEGLARLIADEGKLRMVEALSALEVLRHLPDTLRVNGDYARLIARARDKAAWLAAAGLENPGLADAGITEAELWRWYFVERLNLPDAFSENGALDLYAKRIGLGDAADLRRVVLREYCYARHASGNGAGEQQAAAPI